MHESARNGGWRRRVEIAVGSLLIRCLASGAGTWAAVVVGRIPGLWRRMFLSPVLPPLATAGIGRLKELVAICPDTARILFSMALAHLEPADRVSDARALACLRSASFLDFEASERIDLYRAILAARRGDMAEATQVADGLDPRDFAASETAALRNALARPGTLAGESAAEPRLPEPPGSVLVLGDPEARCAMWFAGSRYLWVSEGVNGLTLAWASGLHQTFDAVCGEAALRSEARAAGIRFRQWIPLRAGSEDSGNTAG